MEFVNGSTTIQSIGKAWSKEKTLSDLLGNKDPQKENQIRETFIKSCAGYAVGTYFLAIGDRHLENLMLTKGGNMFHLDFGIILNKHPNSIKKLLATELRMEKFMIALMGESGR